MNIRAVRISLWLVALAGIVRPLQAQDLTGRERERVIDSIAHPALSETAASVMEFDRAHICTGVIDEDAGPYGYAFTWVNTGDRPAVERILCQNAGDSPLTIGAETALLPPYIKVSCEPETIAPGETADIVIRFDPSAAPARMLDVIPIILTGISLPPSQRTVKAVFTNRERL